MPELRMQGTFRSPSWSRLQAQTGNFGKSRIEQKEDVHPIYKPWPRLRVGEPTSLSFVTRGRVSLLPYARKGFLISQDTLASMRFTWTNAQSNGGRRCGPRVRTH